MNPRNCQSSFIPFLPGFTQRTSACCTEGIYEGISLFFRGKKDVVVVGTSSPLYFPCCPQRKEEEEKLYNFLPPSPPLLTVPQTTISEAGSNSALLENNGSDCCYYALYIVLREGGRGEYKREEEEKHTEREFRFLCMRGNGRRQFGARNYLRSARTCVWWYVDSTSIHKALTLSRTQKSLPTCIREVHKVGRLFLLLAPTSQIEKLSKIEGLSRFLFFRQKGGNLCGGIKGLN